MSTTSTHYKAFELTKKGMELRQYAIAGDKEDKHFSIDFSRGAIGQGRPSNADDIFYMTEMVEHSVDAPLKESYAESTNHIMVIVINNADFKNDVLMTEIGIFARLLDAKTGEEILPEILYGYTYTDRYDYIPVAKSYFVYREIRFNTILSREGKFELVFDTSKVFFTHKDFLEYLKLLMSNKGAVGIGYDNSNSGLNAVNLQEAIDEIVSMTPVECVIEHNLSAYPKVLVLQTDAAYGMGGYGDGGYGGGSSIEVKSKVVYDDCNKLRLRILKNVSGIPEVERVGRNVFILRYKDTALYVLLLENYSVSPGVDEDLLSGEISIYSKLAVEQLIAGQEKALSTKISTGDSTLTNSLNKLEEDVTNNKTTADTAISSINSTISSNKVSADKAIDTLELKVDSNMKEIKGMLTPMTLCDITHGLDMYPSVLVLEVKDGYGMQSYGDGAYGGDTSSEVKSIVSYYDRNALHIDIFKDVSGTPEIEQAGKNEFIVRYESTAFFIVLK